MRYLKAMQVFNYMLTKTRNVLPSEKLSSARQNVLKKCDFIVDIGANDGQWMNQVRKRGFKGNALCIEPIKANYKSLELKELEKTSIMNCAVGNKNGFVEINLASNNGLSSSILELDAAHKNAAPEIEFVGKEKVKILKLSKILETNKYKNIYVKIDTQGYEYNVLRSISKENFSNILAFEIETNIVSTYKETHLIEDVIKFLRQKGYQPMRLENGLGMPNFGQQLQVDIIFIRS